jgi:drug/metabolite transporter (DMT)-like permease
LQAIVLGTVGVLIIVAGGWRDARLDVIGLGLSSGFSYAVVLICLRVLRNRSSMWLTVINHLAAGLVLLPFVLPFEPMPTPRQWVVLFIFGAVQMGVPYLLMARGLRSVSPQEAGTITLLEPIFNPLWAYLVAKEVPSSWTFAGGAFLLGALAWRYWPRRPLLAAQGRN